MSGEVSGGRTAESTGSRARAATPGSPGTCPVTRRTAPGGPRVSRGTTSPGTPGTPSGTPLVRPTPPSGPAPAPPGADPRG
eukprot:4103915-Pyramimonas_sp.AAC.1